jgi:preprotein translocase subunit SecY
MFLLLALIVYRIGAHIPVPGIDPINWRSCSRVSGRHPGHVQHVLGWRAVALHDLRAGDHAVHLGVDHHAVADDRLAAAGGAEEGRRGGRRKITQYTRYGTVVLATFQAFGIAVRWNPAWPGARSRLMFR